MAKVQTHDVVSYDYAGPDRRRSGLVGKLQRGLIWTVRSRWVAMFAVAFAVSFAFQQVDNIGERRVERQQRILTCVISGVANSQALTPEQRVKVTPILQVCEDREHKK